MSLKTKIGLSFFISSSIIAILSLFEFVNFMEIKKEIQYLKVADTIRNESLQVRRHEKNFFLYPDQEKEEFAAIQQYIAQLDGVLKENSKFEKAHELADIQALIHDYVSRLEKIKQLLSNARSGFRQLQSSNGRYSDFFPLIEAAFNEQPLKAADLLKKAFNVPESHSMITILNDLDSEISLLRKTGEDLLASSRNLDKVARSEVDDLIRISQAEIIVFMLLFLLSGITTLYLINRNVVKRLKLMIALVEGTGKGQFPQVDVSLSKWDNDEVGMLIREFNNMERELLKREAEINRKNTELLQSKKLAAIGTLAAGVAHELNNPLNNIYLSVQVLKRMAGDNCPHAVNEIVEDITSQSARVKHIVGELLEFARGKEPNLVPVELQGLISKAFKSLSGIMDISGLSFSVDSDRKEVMIEADPDQMEQVFINLFHNAVEAMAGKGHLKVAIDSEGPDVKIRISDTGPGIPRDKLERIFEPFFTTKDKGTGLGLAIIFNIILKHNGDINAESEEGKGTTFVITLPRGKDSHGV
ncbi:MAG TPA: ATP-binding protein [Dissulfurispiraceae bacterium]|nr:ATP-binding protein [Dissulfurispiraceae bacterium]